MVRIVGSHHFAQAGQIVPVMYPYLKKHNRDLRAPVTDTGSRGHLSPSQSPDYNMLSNDDACNIPNLDILNPRVLDVHAAEKAVKALRVAVHPRPQPHAQPHPSWAVTWVVKEDGDDVEMSEPGSPPQPPGCSGCADNRRDSTEDTLDNRLRQDADRQGRPGGALTEPESDSTDTQQTTADGLARKERRRQRNKMSARAYRDRKRGKAHEQEQVLATLEAEQASLLESLRKLQEEKREFLQFLKSEMNIDMTKTESDDVSMNVAES